jgi:hypothetical protein
MAMGFSFDSTGKFRGFDLAASNSRGFVTITPFVHRPNLEIRLIFQRFEKCNSRRKTVNWPHSGLC